MAGAPIFEEGIEIHEIPGDHWQVLSEPGIDVLAKTIHGCLSQFDSSLLWSRCSDDRQGCPVVDEMLPARSLSAGYLGEGVPAGVDPDSGANCSIWTS